MITYFNTAANKISVYLDGEHVGDILKVPGGYQYLSINGGVGQVLPTIRKVKDTLEYMG